MFCWFFSSRKHPHFVILAGCLVCMFSLTCLPYVWFVPPVFPSSLHFPDHPVVYILCEFPFVLVRLFTPLRFLVLDSVSSVFTVHVSSVCFCYVNLNLPSPFVCIFVQQKVNTLFMKSCSISIACIWVHSVSTSHGLQMWHDRKSQPVLQSHITKESNDKRKPQIQ